MEQFTRDGAALAARKYMRYAREARRFGASDRAARMKEQAREIAASAKQCKKLPVSIRIRVYNRLGN